MSESIQVAPAVVIRWDDDNKAVSLNVDASQVRNPEFALAVLDMAKRVVEQQIRMGQLAALQHQQQNDALARKVMRAN